ncbi:MAG: transposase [Ornithinimicrobium sp.]|uniref:transposase n=1 Tax=Ornithinimicrobium sp. TaxID=1977084 RepID=UPI003D9BEB7F
MRLGCCVIAADMPETWRLWHTINAWWPQILTLITTGVTNARTEAANTTVKQIKRTGGGTETPSTTEPVSCCAAPADPGGADA